MPTTAARRRTGGLIDRRLAARMAVTRRYLAAAVAVGMLSTAAVVLQAVLLATVIERVVLHRATLDDVGPYLVGLAAAFAGRAVLLWVGEAASARTSAAVTSELRRRLLRHALDLGPSWLAGQRAGELSLTATRGTAALDVYFGRYLPQAILAGLAPIAILVWVGVTDPWSFLILAGLVALVPLAMVFFGRRAAGESRRQWRQLSSLSSRFLDLVQGLPTLRAFGRETQGRREVAEATDALRRTTLKTLRVAFLSALALEFLSGIGVGLVAMVLGLRLLGGSVSLYVALAVLLVSPEVFLPLRRAGAEFHASTEGRAAAERILDVLDVPVPSVPVPSVPVHGVADVADVADVAPPRHGGERPSLLPEGVTTAPAVSVRLTTVGVVHPGRGVPALEDFCLDLAPGEHVALVGPSGAGKSTALSVILGFVRPDRGAVRIGLGAGGTDVDLASIDPATWRRHVTWVPQRPHLFAGTLRSNLLLGDPGATPDALRRAVETAGLDELVDGLAAGIDTPVGEAGLTLSAGERSRLAIARALLRDTPLVLLDEPVAHLDTATESRLRDALAPWLADRTVLIAAHRPELVGRIDRIVHLAGREGTGAETDAGPDAGPDAGADDAEADPEFAPPDGFLPLRSPT
jgi:thiol reductant ABC exporter CydD subunit